MELAEHGVTVQTLTSKEKGRKGLDPLRPFS